MAASAPVAKGDEAVKKGFLNKGSGGGDAAAGRTKMENQKFNPELADSLQQMFEMFGGGDASGSATGTLCALIVRLFGVSVWP